MMESGPEEVTNKLDFLESTALPQIERLELFPGVVIVDLARFREALVKDLRLGEGSPRARYGGMLKDLDRFTSCLLFNQFSHKLNTCRSRVEAKGVSEEIARQKEWIDSDQLGLLRDLRLKVITTFSERVVA